MCRSWVEERGEELVFILWGNKALCVCVCLSVFLSVCLSFPPSLFGYLGEHLRRELHLPRMSGQRDTDNSNPPRGLRVPL